MAENRGIRKGYGSDSKGKKDDFLLNWGWGKITELKYTTRAQLGEFILDVKLVTDTEVEESYLALVNYNGVHIIDKRTGISTRARAQHVAEEMLERILERHSELGDKLSARSSDRHLRKYGPE